MAKTETKATWITSMNGLLDSYKEFIQSQEYDEIYKWQIARTVHENWDLEANDLAAMIDRCFTHKHPNLWSGSHYLPKKMLMEWAEAEQEPTREALRDLLHGSSPLDERMRRFKAAIDDYVVRSRPGLKRSSYHDLRAMTLWLGMVLPEEHYLFKATMVDNFCVRTGYPKVTRTDERFDRVHPYYDLCEQVRSTLLGRPEIIADHRAIRDQSCYADPGHHLLTQDFIYYVAEILDAEEVKALLSPEPLGLVMVNITWNSNDWKGPSNDPSNHKWVQAGNTPHESWNFDFGNQRNTPEKVYGYSQRTVEPRLPGDKNLVIFHSQGKIVGFYGRATVLREKVPVTEGQDYNIIGDRALSLVLNNKLDDIKAKGYLEDKQRMGQNGFIYLKDPNTALQMIDEAVSLNPEQEPTLMALRAWVAGKPNESNGTNKTTERMSTPLNRILYGPPGTGKTHHTINAAVEICDPKFYAQHAKDRPKIKARYEALRMKDWKNIQGPGRIGFCTFHQSFGYEDFVEGIKPMKPAEGDSHLKYDVRPGILKQMVQRAEFHASGEAEKVKSLVSFTADQMDKAEFYKLSLGDSQNADDQVIYDHCIEHGVIAIGFLAQHDLTGLTEAQVRALPLEAGQSKYDHTAMSYFAHYLKEGHYVVVTFGLYAVRAIGRVTGDYYYDPKSEIGYPHFRKVEWLATNEAIPAMEIYGKQFSQQTIYKLKKEYVQRDFFVKSTSPSTGTEETKNFVLIIDEINRGNVAGIFGELITLIEENKRKGKPEALEVTLPYSQEPFSIPANLHIIGTMNTADRSVEALDAALRRRFSFMPMMPDTKDLKPLQNSKVDLHALLSKINDRLIQFLDEDHQIGHSHFWELHKEKDALPELRRVFAEKVIPQLEEYFHRDRARLRLVLGNAFVEKVEADEKLFNGDADDMEFELRPTYKLRPRSEWTEDAFVAIHG